MFDAAIIEGKLHEKYEKAEKPKTDGGQGANQHTIRKGSDATPAPKKKRDADYWLGRIKKAAICENSRPDLAVASMSQVSVLFESGVDLVCVKDLLLLGRNWLVVEPDPGLSGQCHELRRVAPKGNAALQLGDYSGSAAGPDHPHQLLVGHGNQVLGAG